MREKVFTDYFKNNSWNGKESVSGPGSDYDQVKFLIPELEILLQDLNIKTMLDAPCGDFNWMRRVDLSKIKYLGVDIVEDLIGKNNKKYRKTNVSFKQMDIVKDKIPKVDLIMVRDCFVHLPNSDIFSATKNIKNSESKYLLTTNFFWQSFENNKDIRVGGWRRIDFTSKPFNFPYPEKIIIEGNNQSNDRDKTMSLWKIKDLPEIVKEDG